LFDETINNNSIYQTKHIRKTNILQNKSILLHHKIAYFYKKGVHIMFKIRKGYDSESKTFRLPIELIEKLDVLAMQNKLSLNQLVIQCLMYAVENIDVNTEEKK